MDALRLAAMTECCSSRSLPIIKPTVVHSSFSSRFSLACLQRGLSEQMLDLHQTRRARTTATAAVARGSQTLSTDVALSTSTSAATAQKEAEAASRVVTVRDSEEYERLMAQAVASRQVVVVEVTLGALPNTGRIYPKLVQLAQVEPDALFLRIFGDANDALRQLAGSLGVARVPSYVLFKDGARVHEDTGMDEMRLRQQLLYYGDHYSSQGHVEELNSEQELESFMVAHRSEDKLVVLQATVNFCEPCVRVYPTVLHLANRMADTAVFARVFGDHNESTAAILRQLGVIEAPTFFFYRGGQLLGQYVGSGRGALIGEVLRHQGVAVC